MKNKFWNILEKVAIAVEPASRQRMAAVLVHKNDVVAMAITK